MVFIRADANERIGVGHIMRCQSIARALEERGEDVVFITADHRSDSLIHGFRAKSLNTDWMVMDQEVESLIGVIRDYKPSALLIDSYYVTQQYFKSLKPFSYLVYIDDLNAQTWDVDCLINYNVYGPNIDYSSYHNRKTMLLLGPRYAPLRREFINVEKYQKAKHVTSVFVSAGGADPAGITEKLIENICNKWESIVFHVVIGMLNPRKTIIERLTRKNTILHFNERNMTKLIRNCDIAISAAGSTLYELCAMGIPTITYTIADNQILAAEQFESLGIMLNAGDCRKESSFIEKVSFCFQGLIEDFDSRIQFSNRMQALVDGYGADRIVNCLLRQV